MQNIIEGMIEIRKTLRNGKDGNNCVNGEIYDQRLFSRDLEASFRSL